VSWTTPHAISNRGIEGALQQRIDLMSLQQFHVHLVSCDVVLGTRATLAFECIQGVLQQHIDLMSFDLYRFLVAVLFGLFQTDVASSATCFSVFS
jgi:hypothetical protein